MSPPFSPIQNFDFGKLKIYRLIFGHKKRGCSGTITRITLGARTQTKSDLFHQSSIAYEKSKRHSEVEGRGDWTISTQHITYLMCNYELPATRVGCM